ncbi:MinD/ParA family protein [Hippea maritima]|uniref:Cobyrinic acid ac-diamide synthase n=1 Tax=Hippea maritima (strain ATCC 700847 / DSM 10411 / MH2) TaxID=760142 RepID=F2LUW6_HIPMA|nr:MinD/ParA family protein [Hippea maritima]AEA33571.1 Cobyrinic acid ac-diamide synthase [Hippea maritima DSM 10411]
MADQAEKLRKMVNEKNKDKKKNRVIAFTSGKGGVGKTNIVANTAYLLSSIGKKVIVFDADLGLANIDILLGLKSKYSLINVIKNGKKMKDIMIKVNDNFHVIPAGSGVEEIANINEPVFSKIKDEMLEITKDTDILLIDTGAGISRKVTFFLKSAEEIVTIATPEPTSVADAYAIIKIASTNYKKDNISIFINMAKNPQEAENTYNNLNKICKNFLKKEFKSAGFAVMDKNLPLAVKQQKPIAQLYPNSNFTIAIKKFINNMFKESIKVKENPIARFFASLFGGG